MNRTILEMKGITKYIFDAYGNALRNATVKILDKVDFDLREGEVHILVGENGAGKSTTLRLIMNTITRDSGEITVLGQDNRSDAFRELKNDIGVVLDEAYFPEVLNPRQVGQVMSQTYTRWD